MTCRIDADCESGNCINNKCDSSKDEDSDDDGMPDYWENNNRLNPLVNDAFEDPDQDGVNNLEEYRQGTDPNNADTDGDGATDGEEIEALTDPNDPTSLPKSALKSILLLIIAILVVLGGGGYLAYVEYQKKKTPPPSGPPLQRLPTGPRPRYSGPPSLTPEQRSVIQRRKEVEDRRKKSEMSKLFGAFGGKDGKPGLKPTLGKEPGKKTTLPETPTQPVKKIKASEPAREPTAMEQLDKVIQSRKRKPKEDHFVKLGELSRRPKRKTKAKVISDLRNVGKKKQEGDSFKRLQSLTGDRPVKKTAKRKKTITDLEKVSKK